MLLIIGTLLECRMLEVNGGGDVEVGGERGWDELLDEY